MPRLAADCDPTRLQINPTEGYLLSRVDGLTPWSALREMGGMAPEEIDRLLEQWLKIGVLEFETEEEKEEATAGPKLPEARVDASLDIDTDIQREILAFGKKLGQPYHEILGVARDANNSVIKKAYFKLSKKFHPDRYFRRNLGDFTLHIETIFKKVLEAYELLSDPTTRAELERSLGAGGGAGPPPDPAKAGKAPRKTPRIAARMSLLAQHERQIVERRRKAKNFFESGMAAFGAERWLEAARGVRLAIAYDPRNDAFRDAFANVQRRAYEEQAKALVQKADEAWGMHEFEDAGRYYEEAMHYRPFDGEITMKVARIAHQVHDDLRKAKEFAASACELEPRNASFRLIFGRIFKDAGLKANARREFEAALRLDPALAEAKQELKSVR